MIRIVVDSAADCALHSGLVHDLIALTVTIDGQDYLDQVDLTPDRFYDLLTEAEEFPKTSQPSPEAFYKVFLDAKQAGDPVLCFTVSSALSGTYQSACIAKGMAEYEDIYIVSDEEALATARDLARKEGLMCGISSGTNVAAAIRMAQKLGPGKTVVTVLPDTAERYFSTPLFED